MDDVLMTPYPKSATVLSCQVNGGDRLSLQGSRILGTPVSLTTDRGVSLSPAEYLAFHPPTLALLRNSFFNRDADPSYRQSILELRGFSEVTSTFLMEGKEAIEQPRRVWFDTKRRVWEAEGGYRSPVDTPADGWILEFDTLTGFPSRTSKDKDAAQELFGDDASYFYALRHGLRAVLRYYDIGNRGPFCVYAHCTPYERDIRIMSRSCVHPSSNAPMPRYPYVPQSGV